MLKSKQERTPKQKQRKQRAVGECVMVRKCLRPNAVDNTETVQLTVHLQRHLKNAGECHASSSTHVTLSH